MKDCMKFEELPLKGLYLIKAFSASDDRGLFVKNFHKKLYEEFLIGDFNLRELFYSESKKDVLRGMHFQIPPKDHSKIVFVMQGSLLDVVVDIRKNSPTYGKYHCQKLDYQKNEALLIPSGFAHGFLSLEDKTKMIYLVSSEHSQEHDYGIKWDSFDFSWPSENPIVSKRDSDFPSYQEVLAREYFK